MTKKCRWTENEKSEWFTDCGERQGFFVGGPLDNSYLYCPYCGGAIVEKPYQESEEEEDAE